MSRSSNLDLRFVVRALRRRLPLFLVAAVVVPAVALVGSLVQHKQYTGTATLLFRDPQFDQKLFGSSYTQSEPDPTRQAVTNVGLVSLPRVARLTAARLHGAMTEAEVESGVSIGSGAQSDLVTISAQAPTPTFAARLATTFAETYIAFRQAADQRVIASAEGPLRQQIHSLPASARGGQLMQSLEARLSQLEVLAQLQTGGAELVQPAEVPLGPSSPATARNLVIGVLLGLLLGAGLVVLAEALDRRLRDPDEIEETFGQPVLTTVPERPSLAAANTADHPSAETEAFRMLWANLRYYTLSRSIRSVLITSADRDDGKSTVAWELAHAAASAGSRVLLVEADLRNPTFGRRYGIDAPFGLTHVLTGEVSAREAITRRDTAVELPATGSAGRMDVLLAGHRPPNPADLLQSAQISEFMVAARAAYDIVIVDTPPAAAISDAIPLIGLVDGVVVVVRLGRTLRDHVGRLRRQLSQVDAPVLGLVVNSAETADPYAYEYGYGDPQPASTNGHGPSTVRPEAAAGSSTESRPRGGGGG